MVLSVTKMVTVVASSTPRIPIGLARRMDPDTEQAMTVVKSAPEDSSLAERASAGDAAAARARAFARAAEDLRSIVRNAGRRDSSPGILLCCLY